MSSPVGRSSYPKRGQRTIPSYSGRRQRRSAGVSSRITNSELSSRAAAQKWTKVFRNPKSLVGEPYFGSSPSASFVVPMWVKVSELTEEEKLKYEEVEKKKEEERLAWKNAIEKRRASEVDAKEDADENDMNDGNWDEDDDRSEANDAEAGGVEENPSSECNQNETDDALNEKDVVIEELAALNQTLEDTTEPSHVGKISVEETNENENSMRLEPDVAETNQNAEDCAANTEGCAQSSQELAE